MKYRVNGVVAFNVTLVVDAENKDEAEELAMDRMDEGALDGFTLGEAVGDNEVCGITLIEEGT